jgi:hypothetical protein
MKLIVASALLLVAPAIVLAQTPAKTEAKSAAKPAAKAAKTSEKAPAKKTAAAKREPSASRVQLKSAASQVAAGLVAAEAALTPAELAIAERVHTGKIPCELGAFVSVTAEPTVPGHFHVEGKGFKYFMAPVATTTNTVRLEDQKGGAVWLQIGNKSMLMNQKIGQRLADECMSPEQQLVAEAIKKNPPISVLEPMSK